MITVFGSLNVDLIMAVEARPRPGETVLCPSYELAPGGKGANQALAAALADAGGGGGEGEGESKPVAMVGMVGDDTWGKLATGLLAAGGVDLAHIGRATLPTGCASIWVDAAGENAIVAAGGANRQARADQVPAARLGPGNWVVLQMEVDPAENAALIERAAAAGGRILLNAAPAMPVAAAVLDRVDILVVNEIEAKTLAEAEGLRGADEPGAHLTLGRALAERHALTCVVTLGGAGAVAATADATTDTTTDAGWSVDALPITPVDTSGAGDAFVGTLAAGLDRRLALPEALRLASTGAGLACLGRGCQPAYATGDEIRARQGDLAPAQRLY